jgi:hypothetical protein
MPAHHKNRILYDSFVSSRAQIRIFSKFFAALLACKRQAFLLFALSVPAGLPAEPKNNSKSEQALMPGSDSKGATPDLPSRRGRWKLSSAIRAFGPVSDFELFRFLHPAGYPPDGLQPTTRIQRAKPSLATSLRLPLPALSTWEQTTPGRTARINYTTMRPEGSAHNTILYKDLTHKSARPGRANSPRASPVQSGPQNHDFPAPAGKSEARISKPETSSAGGGKTRNPNLETRNKHEPAPGRPNSKSRTKARLESRKAGCQVPQLRSGCHGYARVAMPSSGPKRAYASANTAPGAARPVSSACPPHRGWGF